MKTGYFAPDGLEDVLKLELGEGVSQWGRLLIQPGPPLPARFVQNVWYDVQEIPFQSIGEAVKKLRALGRLWSHYPLASHRRAELIQSQLPYFSPKPLSFLSPPPKTPIGAWTLTDDHHLLVAPSTSSPFAQGEVRFQESKFPPSRAYLKLWEWFTLTGHRLKKGDRCLEIGASPGSWTWVLQQMGAEVTAVDKAPLDPRISNLLGVKSMIKDAFSLTPQDFPDIQWVFSDVVCYPEKLLKWVLPWVDAGVNLVCTIKFQGTTDYGILKEFERILGSSLIHLFHNKHELTWFSVK